MFCRSEYSKSIYIITGYIILAILRHFWVPKSEYHLILCWSLYDIVFVKAIPYWYQMISNNINKKYFIFTLFPQIEKKFNKYRRLPLNFIFRMIFISFAETDVMLSGAYRANYLCILWLKIAQYHFHASLTS